MSSTKVRGARWKRIVIALALGFAGTLVLGEIGARLWQRFRSRPFDSGAARMEIEVAVSRASQLVPTPETAKPLEGEFAPQQPVMNPFTGYLLAGVIPQIDHDLERSRSNVSKAQYDILIVGGSVAAIFGQWGRDRLIEKIREDPSFARRPITVYQYGMGGFKQPQSVNLAQYLFALGISPECVIDIDGFNEVALGNTNASLDSNPLMPSIHHWGSLTYGTAPDRETIGAAWVGLEEQASIQALGQRALSLGVYRSALLSSLLLKKLHASEVRAQVAFKEYTDHLKKRSSDLVRHGPAFEKDTQSVIGASVKCWEESSRSLRAMCDARGILYLHVLQPTLHDTGSKVLTKREIDNGLAIDTWVEGVHIGYPLLRAAGERLKAGGENFIDATQLFAQVKHRVYYDACHFDEGGNQMLADLIASELLRLEKAGR